jgi:HD-GYP domain-containing protein (c-di-GMP phosphodiesterase class II)
VSPRIEDLLRDLQNGVAARQLYPPEHPRVRDSLERIVNGAASLLARSDELSVFAVEDRVIHEGRALPGCEAIAHGLFHALRSRGYHRMTIRRGATVREFETLLGALAESGRSASGASLESSTNIRLSSLDSAGEKKEAASDAGAAAAAAVLAEQARALRGVWGGVLESHRLDVEAVAGIVLTLSKTIEENIGALLPMAELKSHDQYTATHITNVAILAMALGEVIGLPKKTVHDVGIAALLHDVGKLQVPTEILNTPEALTEAEIAALRRHPEEGARTLISSSGVPELAVVVAYEHHIRFDGGGYPAVPRGWKTNLASALTQIADVYDALRSDRPYRKGLDRERIRKMMTADAGTHFDPELLEAFFAHVVPAGEDG